MTFSRGARAALGAILLAAALGAAACGSGGDNGDQAPTARSQWSIIEDHNALIRSGPERRQQVLDEFVRLGADTVRIPLKWNEVAPAPRAARRPAFDGTDPGAYPGFAPYDEAVRGAHDRGLRVLIDLAPDAPRWATRGAPPVTAESVNRFPDVRAFADFSAAVARRYSGDYKDLPSVEWFSIWDEPNHHQFLKPARSAPQIYRAMVAQAVPRI